MSTLVPMVDFLEIPEEGLPRLVGQRCTGCAAVFFDARCHCAACGARDAMSREIMVGHGQVHAFTIVHRSFPGIPVPYVSAVVDLDGGGTLKGNLIDADPASVRVGMSVETVFVEAHQADTEGRTVLTYAFRPAEVRP